MFTLNSCPLPPCEFGSDHWSTLAYIETRVVDYKGVLDPAHMRTNHARHPGIGHRSMGRDVGIGDEPAFRYPTKLRQRDPAVEAPTCADHDDWDCADDMKAAGMLTIGGTGLHRIYQLTELGWKIAGELRAHTAAGLGRSMFVPNMVKEPEKLAPASAPDPDPLAAVPGSFTTETGGFPAVVDLESAGNSESTLQEFMRESEVVSAMAAAPGEEPRPLTAAEIEQGITDHLTRFGRPEAGRLPFPEQATAAIDTSNPDQPRVVLTGVPDEAINSAIEEITAALAAQGITGTPMFTTAGTPGKTLFTERMMARLKAAAGHSGLGAKSFVDAMVAQGIEQHEAERRYRAGARLVPPAPNDPDVAAKLREERLERKRVAALRRRPRSERKADAGVS